MDRAQHLAWAKVRAQELVDAGEISQAFASMASDLSKHPETQQHSGIELGMMQLMNGGLSSAQQMREYIDGFN